VAARWVFPGRGIRRFNTNRIRELESLRNALGRLLKKVPLELRRDPDFRLLESVAEIQRHITIVHLINRRREFSSSAKDYEFSRATVRQLWEAGLEDMRGACAHPGWSAATEVVRGVRIFDPESSQPR
jgi:NTE family protein